jgi:hypothetical protein
MGYANQGKGTLNSNDHSESLFGTDILSHSR